MHQITAKSVYFSFYYDFKNNLKYNKIIKNLNQIVYFPTLWVTFPLTLIYTEPQFLASSAPNLAVFN